MKYISYIFLIFILFAGCSSSEKTGNKLSRDIEELKSAPNEIILDGKSFFLEAYIWRNLMPSPDSSLNRSIMASIKIISADGSEISDSLEVVKLWMINKNSVWETKSVRATLLSPDLLELYVSGGPVWDKGIKIDAVVETKFKNQVKLLGIKNQEIHAVY